MKRIRTLIQWAEPQIPGKPVVWHEPGEVADIDEAAVFDLDDLIESGAVTETTEMLTLTADEGTAPVVKGIKVGRPARGADHAAKEES